MNVVDLRYMNVVGIFDMDVINVRYEYDRSADEFLKLLSKIGLL